jgi:hypothetical protein
LKKLAIIIFILGGAFKGFSECGTQFVDLPLVQNISVDIAGNVTICWDPVFDASGLNYYIIFRINPGTGANDSIDQVLLDPAMPLNYCYTLNSADPFNNSETEVVELAVVAVDVCSNKSAVGGNYHNTILLQDSFDVCGESILLDWNPYDDFLTGLDVAYGVYVNINSSGYTLQATLSDTTYAYRNIVQGNTYEFYVEAIENAGFGPYLSTSNDMITNTSDALKVPIYNYVYTINVLDTTQISLQFTVDTTADISFYRIKRATNLNGNYKTIGTVNAFTGMNPMQTFIDDSDIRVNQKTYYYQVFPVDFCGVEGTPYNWGNNVLLSVISSPIDAINTITLLPYLFWDSGVDRYELFRSVGGVWETMPIAVFYPFMNSKTYVDDITKAFYGDGEFCYKVIAFEKNGPHVDNFSLPATSQSNTVCVIHDPLLYVPNAFSPKNGINAVFQPFLTFSDPESYLLQVYNKWGQVIFETNNVNEPWNGKMNNTGFECQQEVYIYRINFETIEGDSYLKRGKVTLLR